ncbi:hypothetical protein F4804DRAFT_175999 [Jackrogersella minutella]|nr:hypothetical protein F4804DRAFT_175999 [Jackrogersella minutella]
MNILWLFAYTLVELLQCRPLAKFWDSNVEGTCIQVNEVDSIGTAVLSLIIDAIVLLLLVPRLCVLQINRTRKASLFIIVALGYGVVAASTGHMVTALKHQYKLEVDLTYEGLPILWWKFSVAPITLFGICMPAMVPLGRHVQSMLFSPLASKIATVLGYRSTSRSRTGNLAVDDLTQRTGYLERSARKAGSHTWIRLGSMNSLSLRDQEVQVGNGGTVEHNNFPLQSIRVENDVTISCLK